MRESRSVRVSSFVLIVVIWFALTWICSQL